MQASTLPVVANDNAGDQASGNLARQVLEHLAHELRQPLSGIESVAYYLEMVSDPSDPRLRDPFVRMRRLLAQASWLLDDATRFLDDTSLPKDKVCVNGILSKVASTVQSQDQGALRLDLMPGLPPALLPVHRAEQAFHHLVHFFTGVACCSGLPSAATALDGGRLAVEWEAQSPGWESGELTRLLDPKDREGGLRRFTEAVGGLFRAEDRGGILRVSFLFPSLTDALNG